MNSGRSRGGARAPPSFWVKNEEIMEGRKASPFPLPLPTGLDLPFVKSTAHASSFY